jgi:dynein heavy chain, axonemal
MSFSLFCPFSHGLMVVGPTGGGKSQNIRILCDALTKLKKKNIAGERYEKTKIYHLNPKSITMGQLYGKFDENTVRTVKLI